MGERCINVRSLFPVCNCIRIKRMGVRGPTLCIQLLDISSQIVNWNLVMSSFNHRKLNWGQCNSCWGEHLKSDQQFICGLHVSPPLVPVILVKICKCRWTNFIDRSTYFPRKDKRSQLRWKWWLIWRIGWVAPMAALQRPRISRRSDVIYRLKVDGWMKQGGDLVG